MEDSTPKPHLNGKPDTFGPYPKRPNYYAMEFQRRLFDSQVANVLGADVCCLLCFVSNSEDRIGYRRPPNFFNSQIGPACGFRSEDTLARVRGKAVRSGWLKYRAGTKGRPGDYYVQVPDEELSGFPRKFAGEHAGESAEVSAGNGRGKPRGKRGECADLHSKTPIHQNSKKKKREEIALAPSPCVDDLPWSIEAVPLPSDDPKFIAAWAEWCSVLQAKNKPATNRFAKLKFNEILEAGLTSDEAAFCFNRSAAAGWLNIYLQHAIEKRTRPNGFMTKAEEDRATLIARQESVNRGDEEMALREAI